MSSLSGFSILAGTICKQTAWNMLLDLVHVNWQGSWYKKMYRDPCCTEKNMFYPKVCIIQLLKVAWYRVIALFTLYFFMYDTSIMILANPRFKKNNMFF
jgi:hypothetical protein